MHPVAALDDDDAPEANGALTTGECDNVIINAAPLNNPVGDCADTLVEPLLRHDAHLCVLVRPVLLEAWGMARN